LIRGLRVALRLFRDPDEVRQYVDRYNDLGEREPKDHCELASAEARVSEFRNTGFWTEDAGTMLITTVEGRMIGSIGFRRTSPAELELGYRLLRHDDRRKGYMTEALTRFAAYLFDAYSHVRRLALRTAEDNHASRFLAERCGFRQEGVLRQAYTYRGEIHDWVLYGMLREECPRVHSETEAEHRSAAPTKHAGDSRTSHVGRDAVGSRDPKDHSQGGTNGFIRV